MEPLIGRRLELFLCEKLRAAVPGIQILPFSGGDQTGDAFDVEPPLTVIAASESEKTHQQENTWIIKGSMQYITHLTETTPQQHDISVRILIANLQAIAGEQQDYFTFHGLDIADEKMTEDDKSRCRASIIHFTAGASG